MGTIVVENLAGRVVCALTVERSGNRTSISIPNSIDIKVLKNVVVSNVRIVVPDEVSWRPKAVIVLENAQVYDTTLRMKIGDATRIEGELKNCEVAGEVYTAAGARLTDTHIGTAERAVYIGRNVTADKCYITANVGVDTKLGTNVNVRADIGDNLIIPDNRAVYNTIPSAAVQTQVDDDLLDLIEACI